VVTALQRKLLRDLWKIRGQVFTIALVVASGIASYVSLQSTWSSLRSSRSAYEAQYNFADVFAHTRRSPDSLLAELEAVPDVASVHTRIVERMSLPLPGRPQPAEGRVISLPDGENAPLNSVYITSGRLPDADHPEEIILLSSFALSNGLEIGDEVPSLVGGQQRQLRLVGTGLSTEFIFPMAEGDIAPDDERFFVAWMNRSAVAAQFDLEGAFNDVVFDLQAGADVEQVIDSLDRILDPWGSTGAYGREDQLSARAVDNELNQLDLMATVVPIIFLGVAALLLNVVLARLVQLQRPQIASLKALGYSATEIGMHLLGMVLTIVLLGTALGLGAGGWLGWSLTQVYGHSFRFPFLTFHMQGGVIAGSVALSVVAACTGALGAVTRVVRLPAAEAMRPEDPGVFKRSLFDRVGLSRVLGTSVRMVLRETSQHPFRLALSVIAIALAAAILVVGRYSHDAFVYMMELQFRHAWMEDVTVTFERAVPADIVNSMLHVPGVMDAEALRTVPVRLQSGSRERTVGLQWMNHDSNLREIWDIDAERHRVPAAGVLVTSALADALEAKPGDILFMEVLQGQRPTLQVELVGTVEEPFGMQAYTQPEWGRAWLDEPPLANAVLLRVDPDLFGEAQRTLIEMPGVLTVNRKQSMIDQFNDQMGEMMGTMTLILTILAGIIAVGVVYNNARIALSMRSRDLATLRVLGFTQREIQTIFYGEMAVQVVLAIPLGLWLGQELSRGIAASMDPEIFRLPMVSSRSTWLFASGVLVAAGLLSGLLMHGRLSRLDLIGVLKARE
jgi:putative ABC transport system permease protein